jgi:hypothetical protein
MSETWGEMLAKHEADLPNHHIKCLKQRGWDMNCTCKYIKEILEWNANEVR